MFKTKYSVWGQIDPDLRRENFTDSLENKTEALLIEASSYTLSIVPNDNNVTNSQDSGNNPRSSIGTDLRYSNTVFGSHVFE